MAQCKKDGCRRDAHARELCQTHYKREQRGGHLAPVDADAPPIETRSEYLKSDEFQSAVATCRTNWQDVKLLGTPAVVAKKRTLLAHLELVHFWTVACYVAKVSRAEYLRWVDEDDAFNACVEEASESAVQRAEYRMFEAAMLPDGKGEFNFQAAMAFLNKYGEWNPMGRAGDEMRNAKLIDEFSKTLREALPAKTAESLIAQLSGLATRAARLPSGAKLR